MADTGSNGAHVSAVAEGNAQFTANLHNVLTTDNPNDNLVYSPFSLSAVMAMAYAGTRTQTAQEVKTALKFPSDNDAIYYGYSLVLNSLSLARNEGFTLAAANRVYIQTGFEIKSEFSQILIKSFNVDLQQLDFAQSDESAATINKWVEEATHEKIKHLISPGSLNNLTRIVLVNGIYFKGQWKTMFNIEETHEANFHLDGNSVAEVDMMYKEFNFPYTKLQDLDAHAVALPYKGERLRMLIIVPNKVDGLGKIEGGMKELNPGSIFQTMTTYRNVAVSLPRFKIESTLNLVEPLKKLGMQRIFNSDEADFTGLTDKESLNLSIVIQKAFIEVNEEGSEAAAATITHYIESVDGGSSTPPVTRFKADRPFYFQIVDTQTNFVLFSSSCTNPSGQARIIAPFEGRAGFKKKTKKLSLCILS